MTPADEARIAEYVAGLGIDSWRSLDATERDLLRRALAPAQAADAIPSASALSTAA